MHKEIYNLKSKSGIIIITPGLWEDHDQNCNEEGGGG